MNKAFHLTLCALSFLSTLQLCTAVGEEYDVSSPNGWVTYRQGNTSLVISVPHGGYMEPDDNIIPDRHDGCRTNNKCVYDHVCTDQSTECSVKTKRDDFTKEIAVALWERIYNETGNRPHMIINELHRIKLDANRGEDEATFGNANAIAAFDSYHSFINTALDDIAGTMANGRGLFVDIHGHRGNWTQLAYRLSKKSLRDDNIPNKGTFSLKRLTEDYSSCPNDTCSYVIVRGQTSLGYFLAEDGTNPYDVVPSPQTLNAENIGEYYFMGGYNTKKYGSSQHDVSDAIQIEIPKPIRKAANNPEAQRMTFAMDLGDAIVKFMQIHDYEV